MQELTVAAEQQLLTDFRAGDREAFKTIYEWYWHPMFGVAFRKLKKKAAAEELVQDIFVKLWKNRATVQISRLNCYLFSAVRYAVIDHIRSLAVQEEYLEYYRAFLSLEDSGTEDAIALNELYARVYNGLDELPEKSREVFRLNRLENWPVPKIASHLHLSDKAVEYHLTKSLKFLRLYLKEHLLPCVALLAATLWK
jgi:RNA polymerase sigma-70 factor (ECF subfamily)